MSIMPSSTQPTSHPSHLQFLMMRQHLAIPRSPAKVAVRVYLSISLMLLLYSIPELAPHGLRALTRATFSCSKMSNVTEQTSKSLYGSITRLSLTWITIPSDVSTVQSHTRALPFPADLRSARSRAPRHSHAAHPSSTHPALSIQPDRPLSFSSSRISPVLLRPYALPSTSSTPALRTLVRTSQSCPPSRVGAVKSFQANQAN